MKRVLITLAVATMALGARAQQYSNYIGLSLGSGLNTFAYTPAHGSQSLGLGYDAGLGYVHYFHLRAGGPVFGLGVGLHYTNANAFAIYDFSEVSGGLVHSHNTNVHYDLTTTFDGWHEWQTVDVVGIPVEAFYCNAINKKYTFVGGLGFQLDLPVSGSYTANEGSYSTSGTFRALGSYAISDMPEHGFSTYDATFDAEIEGLAPSVSLLADLGVRVTLARHWGLYIGFYGSYGLTNMQGDDHSGSPLLTLDPVDATQVVYNGTFASAETNSLHLLRVGIKAAIDFGWGGESSSR